MPKKKNTSNLSVLLENHPVRWIILVVLFVAGAGFIFFSNDWFERGFEKDSQLTTVWKEDVERPVRVTVDYGGGKKRAFQGKVVNPLPADDVIRAAAEAGDFTVRFDLQGAIAEVGGIRARGGSRWQWYVNGVLQNDPVEDVLVRGGDQLLLQYGAP